MAVKKLKRYKSLGTDQIPTELTKTGGRKIWGLAHGMLGVCIGQGHLWQFSGN
jgi:hypothetical protein